MALAAAALLTTGVLFGGPAMSADAPFTPAQLAERTLHRRAVEAVIWGMPAANYQLMYQEMVDKVKGGSNQVLYWSRPLDWKNQTLTPNPDVIYLMPFFNTKDVGPMVLEIPPADEGFFSGSIMNYWHAAIEDVGPDGMDQGKGGKYLILPPGYDRAKVPDGFIPMPSDTYQGYSLLRSVIMGGSADDVARAVNYARRIKLYPLSQADHPPATTFLDASEVVFDSAIPYDSRFFQSLHKMVQAEPWLERDKAMIDQLKNIGIERGKPFNPDAKKQQILKDAINEAHAWLDANFATIPSYYAGGQWFFPVGKELRENIQSSFRTQDSYPVDARGSIYTFAFFSAMHAGKSQFYLMNTRDSKEQPLDGKSFYRLHVPANAPVRQAWSMTVYNRDTHTFIRNVPRVGRWSQNPELQKNADGSVDIYFGPRSPAGKESNWIPTDSKGRFEILARFYGPEKPLFDKTWVLGNIEKLK
jgi:hypothetical protein